MFYTFEDEDAMNLKGLRNQRNTNQWDYNCGGYALGTFSWYCPCEDEENNGDYFGDELGNGFSVEKLESRTQDCINKMLNDFDNLRVINSIEELQKNELAVAFRISGVVDDFHFMLRKRNGQWFEKNGGGSIHRVEKDYALNQTWHGNFFTSYYGRIVLFARKI